MSCLEYNTVNSNALVLIPVSTISHIIEHTSGDDPGKTCWIQFLSGKSIHIDASYEEVASDVSNYYKSHL